MTNSISCPVCQNLCSTQAVSCPKCGHPINQTNQSVRVEKNNPKQNTPQPSTVGSGLRSVLWVIFAISAYFALTAISDWSYLPLPVYGYNDSELLVKKISIAFRIAPLIIMIIILAITYQRKSVHKNKSS